MTKRTISMMAISLAVATGLFWARMLTSPPVAEAAMDNGIDVAEIVVPKGMPSFTILIEAHRGARHSELIEDHARVSAALLGISSFSRGLRDCAVGHCYCDSLL